MKRCGRPFRKVVVLALCWGVSSCERCGDADSLAKLIEKQGQVERDRADRINAWETASVGARFKLGDGIRAGDRSSAVLELGQGSFVRVKSGTMIRFLHAAPGSREHGVDVQTGEAEIVAGSQPLALHTGLGLATVKTGARVRVRKTQKGFDYRVEIGAAVFQNRQGETTEVRAGEGVRIGIGEAVLEHLDFRSESASLPGEKTIEAIAAAAPEAVGRDNRDAARQPPTAETPPVGEPAEGAVGGAEHLDRGPRIADLSISAGESCTVHVSSSPVVVEFKFNDKCPEGAVVQRAGRTPERSRGKKGANLALPYGVSRYQVFCATDVGVQNRAKAGGTVYVVRDSGTARLPRVAPTSLVDADGRHYKILYQNLLPTVTIKWPNAPKADSYLLEVVSREGGTKKLDAPSSEYTFRSGSLAEGVHQARFKTRGASAMKSKLTTVEICFDNAAPKASVSEPQEGGFKPGDKVVISGVAVPGWKVSLPGGTLSVDSHYRFSGETLFTDQYRALALRLAHPRKGVHYYLRRAAGGSR